MPFSLPPLPYEKNALTPYISAETLEYHHGKHHQAYVNQLNTLIENSEYENMDLLDIIKKSSGSLFNQAAQVWNHTFYWNCMTPNSPKEPSGKLRDNINKKFGSFENFKDEFSKKAMATFGSGWTWLILNNNKELEIISTSNAETPIKNDTKTLFTCDVWEHAYYIDYRNARKNYLDEFWHVANWDFVADNAS